MTHLLGYELAELRVSVTKGIDSNAGREVQVLAVLNVPYI
jgi:hypothetical protein